MSKKSNLPRLTCMALSISLLLGQGGVWAQTVDAGAAPINTRGLPSLGDDSSLSITEERRMGDEIARQIYRDPDYLDDPVLGSYLNSLWKPLVNAARARGDVAPEIGDRLAWELMIARDKVVNAFAMPGGYLGVNLGLIATTENRSELASVLAHEMTHVAQRHIARMLTQQDRAAPWLLGAMILGALAAGTNVQAGTAAVAGAQALAAQTQLNFSRDMEREADRIGFGVMTEAGFDGEGFVSMFDKLQQASRLNDDGSYPYLRSHPLTTERMADMKARLPLQQQQGPTRAAAAALEKGGDGSAAAVAASTPVKFDELHSLMAARAQVLGESRPDLWRAWLGRAQSAPGKVSLAELYAGALSAMRLGQMQDAMGLAQQLVERTSMAGRQAAQWLVLEIGGARNASAAVRPAGFDALVAQSLASSERASVILAAQADLAMGKPKDASQRLQEWVSAYPRDSQAWQVLSSAYAAQGQRLRSVRAEAEAQVAHLDYAGALERFKAAQSLPVAERSADAMELAIVDARRRDVERLIREQDPKSIGGVRQN